jgi:hypothetical protein
MKRVILERKAYHPNGGSVDSDILLSQGKKEKMKQSKFQLGWNSERIKIVQDFYDLQSKEVNHEKKGL